jgi:Tfp pilus assembly protein PilF
MTRSLLIPSLGVMLLAPAALAQHDGHAHVHAHGTVDFPISCAPAAQTHFDTGLALLHHMMYDQAEVSFNEAAAADPSCAMAHWGIAMTVIHPLWGERPSDTGLAKGAQSLARARPLATTARETDYLAAVEPFFANVADTPYPAQLAAFETGYRGLHEAYPDDVDAAAFFALAHLAVAPRSDRTLANQRAAGALLEELHATHPDHPGLYHYTIHAYDNPALADRAERVAAGYDRLAPEVPHALHMPSHIFVRRGDWPGTIHWNERSAAAALEQPVGGVTSSHYAHAVDYLAYAFLQRGEDAAARDVVERMLAVPNIQPVLAAAYSFAAAPARDALEREQWSEAAALTPRAGAALPWERFAMAESITYFARGLGAARSGDVAGAAAAIAELDRIHATLAAGEPYWATLTDAHRKAVAAWRTFNAGDRVAAVSLMREAADLEDSVDKHPVTPGAVLPARELLGDMLMEVGQPADARAAYDAALATSPNRLRSLRGAALAAAAAGNADGAAGYAARLAAVIAPGATRDGLEEALALAE